MTSIEIWHDGKNRRLHRAEVDLDATSRRECVQLLEAEALRLHRSVKELHLRVWDPTARNWIQHRA